MSSADPLSFGATEVLLTRVLLAALVLRFHGIGGPRFATQPHPAGIARLIDLTFLARPSVRRPVGVIVAVCLVLYAAGIALAPVTLLIFLFIVARGTLNNSQGASGHAMQMLAVVFLAQLAAYGLRAVDGWLGRELAFAGGATYDQLAILWSQQAIIAAYFTSGLTKFFKSGLDWIRSAPRFGLTVERTSQESYYSRLDPACRNRANGMVRAIERHPHLTRLAFAAALLLELATPILLIGRPIAFVGGCSLIAFHQVNGRYLGLKFKIYQALVAVFFLQVPYLIATAAEYLVSA